MERVAMVLVMGALAIEVTLLQRLKLVESIVTRSTGEDLPPFPSKWLPRGINALVWGALVILLLDVYAKGI